MLSDQNQPEAKAGSSTSPSLGITRLVRVAVAGVLMGTANLIPGVSGGTMVLAMGIYQEFIDSVADISRLRISVRRLVFLGVLGLFAVGAILGLAGLILYLLFQHPTAMFALFIGLTLGGAPLLYRQLRPLRVDAIIATLVGLIIMIGILMLRNAGLPHNTPMDVVSGLVGSTTMVLPGISGSYMLLILDQYERVVGAVDDLKESLSARNMQALWAALKIVIPVGIGAILGIIGLSNLLKFLLHRFRRPTVGVLLGILLGSVIGLWPFGKAPGEKALERHTPTELRGFAEKWEIADVAETDDGSQTDENKQRLVETIRANWQQRGAIGYSAGYILVAVVCAVVGFGITFALSRGQLGKEQAAVRG
ncbi:MAG: DUF368 domain-containing protein [Planctomycetota bacterium]